MNEESDLRIAVTLGSVSRVQHRFGTTVATAFISILGDLQSRSLVRKLDVVLSELVNNVLENTKKKSGLSAELRLQEDSVLVRVSNRVTLRQCDAVKRHVANIRRADDPKKLLAETIRTRRDRGQLGGLGLIRLAAETRARLSVSYDKRRSLMRVTAQVALGDKR